jgi:cytoskeleton protein RodZ
MAQSDSKGFGAAIRQAREELGTDLQDLAQTTRIPVRFLEALEAEDWEVVPRGVIGRGFVRALSRELRLPADVLLQRYRTARGDDDAEPDRALPETDWKVELPASPRGRPAVWGAAALILLALAVWRFGPWRQEVLNPPPEQAAVPAAPAAQPPRFPERSSSPSLKQPERTSAPALPPDAATPPSVAPALPTGRQARAVPANVARLAVEASQRVWVRVTPAGEAPQERVLKPGERATYEAHGELELKVGNAGAVRLYWNDTLIGPAGRGSQVVTLSLPRDLPAGRP